MAFYSILPIICFSAFAMLGLFVFSRHPRTAERVLFSVLCFEAFCWQLVWSISFYTVDAELLDFLAKVSYLGITFLPFTFYHFIISYLRANQDKKFVFTFYAFSLILVFLLPTDLFVRGHQKFSWGNFAAPGPIYPLYMGFAILSMSRGVFLLIKALRNPSLFGVSKNQVSYIFVGLVLYYSCALDFAQIYGARWYPVGAVSFLGSFFVISYAILRHKLMDIEVVIKKTLVFAGLFSFVFSVFSMVSFLVQGLLRGFLGLGLASAISVSIIILGYDHLRSLLVDTTDRYLFQKKVNYRILLKEATEYLAYLDSLKRQARRIVAFLLVKARVSNASVYAFDNTDPSVLTLKASRPYIRDRKHRSIHVSHPVAHYMKMHKGPIDLHAVYEVSNAKGSPDSLSKELDEIINLLKEHDAEAAIPCFSGDATIRASHGERYLKGILFLGHQKSDEPYSEEDLDVFFTLGQECSIAFENARLYDEAINKTRQLELKSEELEKTNTELQEAQHDLLVAIKDTEASRQQALAAKEKADELTKQALEAKKKTEEMQQELIRREKLAFVERLVRDIAHEIHNPLLPIRMWTETLETQVYLRFFKVYQRLEHQLQNDEREDFRQAFIALKEASDGVLVNANHIFLVVDTLRTTQKHDVETIGPFDFKILFKEIRAMMMRHEPPQKEGVVSICEDITANLPPIKGNATQLIEVFLNLYRNAQDAMAKRTEKKITIKARLDSANQEFVRIEFSDTGHGISADVKRRLFQRGFTTKGKGGSGFGLEHCRVIIEHFGGNISVESVEDVGATFIINLPVWKGKVSYAS